MFSTDSGWDAARSSSEDSVNSECSIYRSEKWRYDLSSNLNRSNNVYKGLSIFRLWSPPCPSLKDRYYPFSVVYIVYGLPLSFRLFGWLPSIFFSSNQSFLNHSKRLIEADYGNMELFCIYCRIKQNRHPVWEISLTECLFLILQR